MPLILTSAHGPPKNITDPPLHCMYDAHLTKDAGTPPPPSPQMSATCVLIATTCGESSPC